MLHPQARDIPNTLEFAEKNGIDHNAVIGALKSLVADDYVTMVAEDHEAYKLLAEGEAALQNGSPEAQVYKLVKDEGSGKDEIEALAGALAKVGLSQCMQAKWLKIDKEKGGKIFKEVPQICEKHLINLSVFCFRSLGAGSSIFGSLGVWVFQSFEGN